MNSMEGDIDNVESFKEAGLGLKALTKFMKELEGEEVEEEGKEEEEETKEMVKEVTDKLEDVEVTDK